MNLRSRFLVVAASCCCAFPIAHAMPLATQDQKEVSFQSLVDSRGPALVTIKFILKAAENEAEMDVTGVLISPDGLVLASNYAFGGGPFGGRATPKDIKVLVGDDTQGVSAKFIARDTELGLAWIRVEKAPDKPYPYIDFAQHAEVALGDHLYAVRKMGKFFGVANSVAEGRVGAVVTKPRKLIIPSIGLATRGDLALPVFNSAGQVVGVSAFILPESDEMDSQGSTMRGSDFGMILPAKDVRDATQKALEQAASGVSPDAEEPDEKPGVEPTPPR